MIFSSSDHAIVHMNTPQVPRAIITIYPPAAVSINLLTYPPINTAYIPVSRGTPTLLTLPSETPSKTFLFLYLTPNTVTHVSYDRHKNTLSPQPSTSRPQPPGTPGVAVIDAPGEVNNTQHWPRLAGYITEAALSAADITVGESSTSASFTPLPSLHNGRQGYELTAFHLERTRYVTELITSRYVESEERLLAELQLAFLAFSVLSIAEGLDLWTRLIRELCRADGIDAVYKGFSDKFARVLEGEITFLSQCTTDCGFALSMILEELSSDFTRFLENHSSENLKTVLTAAGWEPEEEEGPTVA